MKNILFCFLLATTTLFAQTRTVGLISGTESAAEGYTLFAPMSSSSTFLIDNEGHLVHKWTSTSSPGNSVYLLENGDLLRTETIFNFRFLAGGIGGRIKIISWDGQIIWYFNYSTSNYSQHHDVEYLPNGNILMIAWEVKNYSTAIAAGRKSSLLVQKELWSDKIVEIKPTGKNSGDIVWEWHAWDHLVQDYDDKKENYGVVADHPELIDVNYVQSGQNGSVADWLHTNAVDYNAELDQIMLSVRHFNEVWIIDHTTTTEEAAGHTGGDYGKGGDLLYRFGNPEVYDQGTDDGRFLFGQHNAQWIPAGHPGEGNILLFNNGSHGTNRNYSTVDEFILTVDTLGNYIIDEKGIFLAPTNVWSYAAPNPEDFFSHNISGAQRMPNGNTLICSGGNGHFFEVDSNKTVVWQYINPVTKSGILTQGEEAGGGTLNKDNNVFRCARYTPDYSAFTDRDMTPGEPIEGYTSSISKLVTPMTYSLSNFPNPFNPSTTIQFSIKQNERVTLTILNIMGQEIATLLDNNLTEGMHTFDWNGKDFTSGIYYARLETDSYTSTQKMLLIK